MLEKNKTKYKNESVYLVSESNKSTECLRIGPKQWGHIPLTAPGCNRLWIFLFVRMMCLQWDIKAVIWIKLEPLESLKSLFFFWGGGFCDLGTEDYKHWLSEAHTTDIIDHYTKRTSASTNHLLRIEQQLERALFCFHFNMMEVPIWDPELEG